MQNGVLIMISRLYKAVSFEPKKEVVGPRMNLHKRRFVAQPHAVPAFLVDVKVERYLVALQSKGEIQAIFRFYTIVFAGVPDETRWRLRRDLQLVRKRLN